jgi:hypothetical protein
VLDTECGAEQVDLEHLACLCRIEVGEQAGDLDPGVVDQDVEPAQLPGRLRDGGRPVVVVGDVEVHEAVSLAERLGDLGSQVVLQVGDDHGGARLRKGVGHALTEALGAAGHEGLAAGEVEICHAVLLGCGLWWRSQRGPFA